jgi:Glycosyl hydrolase family 115
MPRYCRERQAWNYMRMTNKEGIQKFFREGIEHAKNYESLIAIGMRGDDDKPMADAGSAQVNFKILERIMKDQRKIIEEVTGKPASKTPQVWTLYSEVLEHYDRGMKVAEDVIILLCIDNWGNVRRLPELNGKHYPGGYSMYYHVAYYGAPHASKWLNMS